MLKEGGWLQWLDIAPPYILIYTGEADNGMPIEIFSQIPRVVPSLDWIGNLPDLLREMGFTDVDSKRCSPQGALKHKTCNVLLALSEIHDQSIN